jgi:hypothetical protein
MRVRPVFCFEVLAPVELTLARGRPASNKKPQKYRSGPIVPDKKTGLTPFVSGARKWLGIAEGTEKIAASDGKRRAALELTIHLLPIARTL